MLAIFDDQNPVRGKLSQQKILWRKDVTLRKVQNSINQSMFSGHFTEHRVNCPAHSCENKYREADLVPQEEILEDL